MSGDQWPNLSELGRCALLPAARPISEPGPVAFVNVYERGDAWVRMGTCDLCADRVDRSCCGNCRLLLLDGRCSIHAMDPDRKPLHCCLSPAPDTCWSQCAIEFLCIAGPRRGQTRRVREPGDVFRNPDGERADDGPDGWI